MSQEQLINAPPRIPSVPQVPLPQTNYGVLEHSGLPFSEPENITDVPPDFGWMSEIQTYMKLITMDKNQDVGVELAQMSVNAPNLNIETKLSQMIPVWQHIPMSCAKWFNATFSFKFIAIKPPRVTGKILLRYSFLSPRSTDSSDFDAFADDHLKRGICKEWDLGASNEFEFDITALCPIQARPTFLPERAFVGGPGISPYAAQQFSYSIISLGTLKLEVAQRLQPGGIFPDSIRIMMFRVLKGASYYTPTDPRSFMPHILGRPTKVKPSFSPYFK